IAAINRIIPEASALLNHEFKTYRRYPIRAPVIAGGSYAIHFLGWRGSEPSARAISAFVSAVESRGLHVFLDKMERIQTDIVTRNRRVETTFVVTVKWSDRIITLAEQQAAQPAE